MYKGLEMYGKKKCTSFKSKLQLKSTLIAIIGFQLGPDVNNVQFLVLLHFRLELLDSILFSKLLFGQNTIKFQWFESLLYINDTLET